uniref:Reverse transcriptase domain-containing protein n=1 Tax=Cannabis sativa TaxID=3483 RepID=A0A803PY90_CANSA
MLKKPVETMDDLLAKASNLTVLDEDGWEINAAGSSVVGEHCAKARFCSNRPMSRPLLKTILSRVWGIADNNWGVEIKFNNNHSSFLNGEPVVRLGTRTAPFSDFWESSSPTLLLDYERQFGLLFPSEGRKIWLPFRYDRLPFMCFNCGFLEHDTRVCAETPKMFNDGLGNWKSSYGPWLKVDDKRDTKIQMNAAIDPSVKKTCVTGSLVQDSPYLQSCFKVKAWADNDDCNKIIQEAWGIKVPGKPLENLNHLIQKCGRRLFEWNLAQKKVNFARSKELKENIVWLSNSPNLTDWLARQKLEKDLNCVEEKREMYWRQRSRALWLRHGDRNTKFFHFKASARRKKNTILGLYDSQGRWRTSEKDLADIAISYFQQLFSQSNGGSEIREELRGCVPCRISSDENRALLEPFSSEEIKSTLFQIHPLKAPGKDGLPETMMDCLGYEEEWTKKIMNCVRSVSFSILLNGSIKGHFRPTRGLRQGDPLSPFLFLLCSEGLSCLIYEAERAGRIQGLRFGSLDQRLSHLFFADDSLVFLEATLEECKTIKEVLNRYELLSGQCINYDKSEMCVGSKISSDSAGILAAHLGVNLVENHTKYLGMPSFVGRNKQQVFGKIREKVEAKLQG